MKKIFTVACLIVVSSCAFTMISESKKKGSGSQSVFEFIESRKFGLNAQNNKYGYIRLLVKSFIKNNNEKLILLLEDAIFIDGFGYAEKFLDRLYDLKILSNPVKHNSFDFSALEANSDDYSPKSLADILSSDALYVKICTYITDDIIDRIENDADLSKKSDHWEKYGEYERIYKFISVQLILYIFKHIISAKDWPYWGTPSSWYCPFLHILQSLSECTGLKVKGIDFSGDETDEQKIFEQNPETILWLLSDLEFLDISGYIVSVDDVNLLYDRFFTYLPNLKYVYVLNAFEDSETFLHNYSKVCEQKHNSIKKHCVGSKCTFVFTLGQSGLLEGWLRPK